MEKRNDLTGMRFGFLTVIKYSGILSGDQPGWLCRCDCGREKVVRGPDLRRGKCTGCGHHRKTIHGQCHTRLYDIWHGMKNRCRPNGPYGIKGIRICDEWHSFESFYEWSLSHGYTDNLTIDRIDFNGDYCPENCRWVTWSEQSRNKSNNVFITFNGQTKILKDWSREMNIPYSTIKRRRSLGWSDYECLFGKEANHGNLQN